MKKYNKLQKFYHITFTNFAYKYLGGKLWYEAKSYYWLNIKGEGVRWDDASQDDCKERYCMQCGKGKKEDNKC